MERRRREERRELEGLEAAGWEIGGTRSSCYSVGGHGLNGG